MRCTDGVALVPMLALALATAPAARGQTPPPPELHEAALESGLRLVVAAPAERGAAAVEAVFVLPVGWANDATHAGSGLAALAAAHATHAAEGEPAWRAEVEAARTYFRGSFALDALEPALAALAKRLTADGVEEERFNQVVQARRPAPVTALDRFREAAWPTTRWGGRSDPREGAGIPAPAIDALKQFLTERCGSEGAVLVLLGDAPAATLELAASRAFASFPRARGVAPAESLEPFPVRPRRVAAPAGAADRAVGFRLAWREDRHGDELALAAGWLESIAGRPASRLEANEQGAIVAFVEADPAAATRLAQALTGRVDELARGRGPTPHELAAALDRIDRRLAEVAASPAGLARLLAESAAEHDDPRNALSRRRRLESAGPDRSAQALRARLPPSGWIEVGPLPPSPSGPGGS